MQLQLPVFVIFFGRSSLGRQLRIAVSPPLVHVFTRERTEGVRLSSNFPRYLTSGSRIPRNLFHACSAKDANDPRLRLAQHVLESFPHDCRSENASPLPGQAGVSEALKRRHCWRIRSLRTKTLDCTDAALELQERRA